MNFGNNNMNGMPTPMGAPAPMGAPQPMGAPTPMGAPQPMGAPAPMGAPQPMGAPIPMGRGPATPAPMPEAVKLFAAAQDIPRRDTKSIVMPTDII